ncbi:hypothetical protein RMATCC62417_12090 [Rhizopus microsporus]|nr:hypothetical protein RMATCC62417_12090 [Rhizopus microsporus]
MNTQYTIVVDENAKRIADMENEFRDVFSTGKVFGTLSDVREVAKAFGVKILKDEVHWVAFHADKYIHLGNRSSNRVEGSHSSLKAALGISSDKLALVSHKIDLWAAEKRDLRNLKNEQEMFKRSVSLLSKHTDYRIQQLQGKVSKFAMDKIKLELAKFLSDPSCIPLAQCNCYYRNNYRLPCKHVLCQFDVIPLNTIAKRWLNISALSVTQHHTHAIEEPKADPALIDANLQKATLELQDLSEKLKSDQDKESLLQQIENLKKNAEANEKRVESFQFPSISVELKGRPKNTKHLPIALEILEEEFRKEAKNLKKKNRIRKRKTKKNIIRVVTVASYLLFRYP